MEFSLSPWGKPIVILSFCSDFLLIKGWEGFSLCPVPESFQFRLPPHWDQIGWNLIMMTEPEVILLLCLVLHVWNDGKKEISQKFICTHSSWSVSGDFFDCHTIVHRVWGGKLQHLDFDKHSIMKRTVPHNKELCSPNENSVKAEKSFPSPMPGA